MILSAVCLSGLGFGQNALLPDASDPSQNASYDPMSLKQKYFYTLNEMFAVPALVGFTIHASFDQYRDNPSQWGRNADSFSMRLASHFGRAFVREDIAFAVRAMDHEDPRYFRMGKGRGWSRARYAVKNTFLTHNDNGTMMLSYGRFIADYATPFLVQSWRPEPFRPSLGFRDGTIGIGMGAANNLWQEFWPDVRKKLPFHRGQ